MFKANDLLQKQTALKVLLSKPSHMSTYSGCNQRALQQWTNDPYVLVRKFWCLNVMQNEKRPIFLLALGFGLVLHIVGVYWWYHPETLWRPLLFLPPHNIPKFWHAVFIIVVNGKISFFTLLFLCTFSAPHTLSFYWSQKVCISLLLFLLTQILPVCVDTVVRQAAMVLKSGLLIHYRNSWGHNSHHQVIG
jgi:hypothetical protein